MTRARDLANLISGSSALGGTGELVLKDVDTADGSSPKITFQTGDTDIAADDVLGTIDFQAPDEGTGTDALLVAAGIEAVSEGDFSASSNATKLSFKTGASETATEKMTIKSDGNVGFNEISPSSKIHAKISSVGESWSAYGGTVATLEGNSSNGTILQMVSNNSYTGEMWFGDAASRNQGRVRYEHANDRLELWANAADRVAVTSDGLLFNGDTAAANALDDYEEGTFTPSYTTSSSDASGVNYGTSNAGVYIKIGRLIHFQLTLHITSASSFGSGTPQIHGLPYTSSSSTPTNNSLRFTISTYDVDFDGGAGQTIHAYIPTTNVSYLQVLTTNDNTVWVVNNTGAFTLKNNSFTTIAGMYITN